MNRRNEHLSRFVRLRHLTNDILKYELILQGASCINKRREIHKIMLEILETTMYWWKVIPNRSNWELAGNRYKYDCTVPTKWTLFNDFIVQFKIEWMTSNQLWCGIINRCMDDIHSFIYLKCVVFESLYHTVLNAIRIEQNTKLMCQWQVYVVKVQNFIKFECVMIDLSIILSSFSRQPLKY